MGDTQRGGDSAADLAGQASVLAQLGTEVLAVLFESMGKGAALVSRDGETCLSNASARDLLGCSHLGLTLPPLCPECVRFHEEENGQPLPPDKLPLFSTLRGGGSQTAEVYVQKRSGGAGRWIEIVSAPVHSTDGEIWGALLLYRDVTSERRLAFALRDRDEILGVIRRGAERFLTAESWDAASEAFLAELHAAVGVDRISIIEIQPVDETTTRLAQRTVCQNSGTEPAQSRSASATDEIRVQISEHKDAIRTLYSGDAVALSRGSAVPAAREIFARRGVESILLVPITLDEALWGVLCLEQLTEQRSWHSLEKEALRAGANVLRAGLIAARARAAQAAPEEAAQTEASAPAVLPDHGRDGDTRLESMVGGCARMRDVFRLIRLAAEGTTSILVTGDTGTGKDLVAQAIHSLGARSNKPFVAVSCGAIAETLLDSELFGYVKGAFTGADRNKTGLIEAADGGTLFLDEVGDVSPGLQLKLLRTLEAAEVLRVGSVKPSPVDVRLITATNKNLPKLLATGEFRQDFYFRIRVFEIHLPPLRERREDIPLLSAHFLRKMAEDEGKDICRITDEATALLVAHSWPGNVRELKNALEHASMIASNRLITAADLPVELRSNAEARRHPAATLSSDEQSECEKIIAALRQVSGHRTKAAEILGVSRVTLWKKMRKFDLHHDAYE